VLLVLKVLKVLLDQVLKETQVLRVLEVQVEHLVLKEPLELKEPQVLKVLLVSLEWIAPVNQVVILWLLEMIKD